MSERDVSEDQVRTEHLAEVDQVRQWVYLFGVIVGGLASMLALIAALGSST
jgi:hypothetical protein